MAPAPGVQGPIGSVCGQAVPVVAPTWSVSVALVEQAAPSRATPSPPTSGSRGPGHGNRWTHVTAAVVVPGCLAVSWWQVTRALGGNTLSWAYVFEWPVFAGYGVFMWWRLTHERPLCSSRRTVAAKAAEGRPAPEPASMEEGTEGEDEELASYNRYLAALNASGRRKHW